MTQVPGSRRWPEAADSRWRAPDGGHTLKGLRRPGAETGLEVIMNLQCSTAAIVGLLASTCCLLALLSCDSSPSAPGGQLVVHVSENGAGSVPDKQIEVVGTVFSRVTDRD